MLVLVFNPELSPFFNVNRKIGQIARRTVAVLFTNYLFAMDAATIVYKLQKNAAMFTPHSKKRRIAPNGRPERIVFKAAFKYKIVTRTFRFLVIINPDHHNAGGIHSQPTQCFCRWMEYTILAIFFKRNREITLIVFLLKIVSKACQPSVGIYKSTVLEICFERIRNFALNFPG